MLRTRPPQRQLLGGFLFEQMVPEDHLLRRIAAVVDFSLVNHLLADCYSQRFGRPAKEPEMMVKLVLLEFLNDLSDVRLAEELRVNVAMRWFAGLDAIDPSVDDTTLVVFRRRIGLEKCRQVFEQVLAQCVAHGLVPGRRAAADCTHVLADAAVPGKHEFLWVLYQHLERSLHRAAPVASLPPTPPRPWRCSLGDLPKVMAEQREQLAGLITIAEEALTATGDAELARDLDLARHCLQQHTGARPQDVIGAVTDADARVGHTSAHQSFCGYRVSTLLDADSGILMAVEVQRGNGREAAALLDLVDAHTAITARPPAALSADKAYDDGELRRQLYRRGVQVAIPLRRQRSPTRLFLNERFSYDRINQTMTCPAEKVTSTHRRGPSRDRSRLVFIFDAADCRGCLLQPRCTTSRKAGRRVMVSDYREEHERALAKTEEYALLLRARSRIEPKHAEAKRFHGMRRARYRGLIKMQLQAYLTATILNVKRMTRLIWTPNLVAQPAF
jgi:transposase